MGTSGSKSVQASSYNTSNSGYGGTSKYDVCKTCGDNTPAPVVQTQPVPTQVSWSAAENVKLSSDSVGKDILVHPGQKPLIEQPVLSQPQPQTAFSDQFANNTLHSEFYSNNDHLKKHNW